MSPLHLLNLNVGKSKYFSRSTYVMFGYNDDDHDIDYYYYYYCPKVPITVTLQGHFTECLTRERH